MKNWLVTLEPEPDYMDEETSQVIMGAIAALEEHLSRTRVLILDCPRPLAGRRVSELLDIAGQEVARVRTLTGYAPPGLPVKIADEEAND